MNLALAVLSLLFYIGVVVLAVVILQWGLEYLGFAIPEKIMKIIWFLALILVLIAIVSLLAGAIHVPPVGLPSLR